MVLLVLLVNIVVLYSVLWLDLATDLVIWRVFSLMLHSPITNKSGRILPRNAYRKTQFVVVQCSTSSLTLFGMRGLNDWQVLYIVKDRNMFGIFELKKIQLKHVLLERIAFY